MSKRDKSLERLLTRPKDFTWEELIAVLRPFGYEELNGAGSRRKFLNKDTDRKIALHKPHPRNIVKLYVIDTVITALVEDGCLQEEKK
ncbi:MAG: type II toxin-antitoxin system HicA family toxin [Nitrosospira sp.]